MKETDRHSFDRIRTKERVRMRKFTLSKVGSASAASHSPVTTSDDGNEIIRGDDNRKKSIMVGIIISY